MTDAELFLLMHGRTDGSDRRRAAAGLLDLDLLFTTHGRIGRSDYWRGVVAIAIIGIAATLVALAVFGPMSIAGRFAQLVITLAVSYSAYCVMAKRFQDHSQPGALALVGIGVGILKTMLDLLGITGHPWDPNGLDWLFLFVHVGIGLWYFILLGCVRGTEGENQYGRAPI